MEALDTKECLLNAAEALFAEQGIQAASLRAITAAANANLAAVKSVTASAKKVSRSSLMATSTAPAWDLPLCARSKFGRPP